MVFNGSSTFYIMNKDIANKKRLDAFEEMINSRLSESEKRLYTSIDDFKVDMISTYHNFSDSKLILRELITKTGLLGVDILLVTFQTVFKGDKVRTAYKVAYTCGAFIREYKIFDLEPTNKAKLDLIDEITVKLDLPLEIAKAVEDLNDYNLLVPLYKSINKKYKALR